MGLLSWLWNEPATVKVEVVEQQSISFEDRLKRIVETSRGLTNRTPDERRQLIEDVTEALDIIEAALNILAAADLSDRAKRIRTRLRTIRTRAERAS